MRHPFLARRRQLLLAGAAAVALPLRAAGPPRRIGALIEGPREGVDAEIASQRDALAAYGWRDGIEVTFTVRRVIDGPIDDSARALVAAGVDVLWTVGTQTTRALQAATHTIPIVAILADPVAAGVARSLGQPGGNVTGVALATSIAHVKQVELVRELVPGLKRVVVFGRRGNASARELAEPALQAVKAAGLQGEFALHGDLADCERVFRARGPRSAALFGIPQAPGTEVAALALRTGWATTCADPELVEQGLLMSYALWHRDPARATAAQIDKVLRGAAPSTLPFELPTDSNFAINLRTARALGLQLTDAMRVRADRLIS